MPTAPQPTAAARWSSPARCSRWAPPRSSMPTAASDLTAVNGTLSLPAELDADGAAADSGGSMELAGQVLQVGAAAKLHANSGFGSITLTACTLSVAAGAQISTTGEQST